MSFKVWSGITGKTFATRDEAVKYAVDIWVASGGGLVCAITEEDTPATHRYVDWRRRDSANSDGRDSAVMDK